MIDSPKQPAPFYQKSMKWRGSKRGQRSHHSFPPEGMNDGSKEGVGRGLLPGCRDAEQKNEESVTTTSKD
jgi:hypothetical protein